nr:hypothetical protein [Tanacetum cinerariifolium]
MHAPTEWKLYDLSRVHHVTAKDKEIFMLVEKDYPLRKDPDLSFQQTLADKAILSGANNRLPMLEKDMYDSWKSRMVLYMMNRQHGRMILESVENGPLLWPTIEKNRVTRPKECKLYDEFDKFSYKKGESLSEFYLRFSLLLNDMNIYNMKLEQFQVNIKFLNTLPPEWSKFVTDVKLVRNLHMINVDQLHAYLGQHEFHANEVREITVICFQELFPLALDVYVLDVPAAKETDMMKLVGEIECFGMSVDEFDKEHGSSDGLQPKQSDISYVHALNEPHLCEIHVVPSKHKADQHSCVQIPN